MNTKKQCPICDEEFEVYPSRKDTAKYCSPKCRSKAYRGEGNPKWRGGKHKNSDGYIKLFRPDHPKADKAGYVYQHRIVMEEYIGRDLKKDEIIHHINGIKDDNRMCNLIIVNAEEHQMYENYWKAKIGHPLRIFSTPWHVGAQRELIMSLPNTEWYYIINHTRKWSQEVRDLPTNVHWVTGFNPKDYDLVLLHQDQQMAIKELGKSKLFFQLEKVTRDSGLPRIIQNHGTPTYPEKFTPEYLKTYFKKIVKRFDRVVVNSHQALKEWELPNSRAIIHGMDYREWFDLKKEPRIVTFISPAGIGEKYYNRRLLDATRDILKEDYGIQHIWMCQDTPSFKNWEHYKTFLGESLIYFNPTFGSPMPRTRGEAMHSGCCIVTTKYHDADTFIEHGENGFIVPNNPESCARLLSNLLLNKYQECVEIGQAGKETAKKIFSRKRLREDWLKLIKEII